MEEGLKRRRREEEEGIKLIFSPYWLFFFAFVLCKALFTTW